MFKDAGQTMMSHPSRGAWIEIYNELKVLNREEGRTPRGVRGLKLKPSSQVDGQLMSHPSRGAWIEIRRL